MTDKMTGKPRGFGFIVFENSDSVAAVLQVQDTRNCGAGALLAFCWEHEFHALLGEETMLSQCWGKFTHVNVHFLHLGESFPDEDKHHVNGKWVDVKRGKLMISETLLV